MLNQSESTTINLHRRKYKHGIMLLETNSLFFDKIKQKHSGLYNCVRQTLEDKNVTISYVVEVVDPSSTMIYEGSMSDWIQYKNHIISPIQETLDDYASTYDQKIQLLFNWSDWGDCLCGSFTYDTKRYRSGFCCLHISEINESLVIPCLSNYLNSFYPELMWTVANVSIFSEYERCIDECVPGIIFNSMQCE